MFESIKKRISLLERRIVGTFPFWPNDADNFLRSIGVDLEHYAVKNPDGTKGYDAIRALSDTAAEDWKEYESIANR